MRVTQVIANNPYVRVDVDVDADVDAGMDAEWTRTCSAPRSRQRGPAHGLRRVRQGLRKSAKPLLLTRTFQLLLVFFSACHNEKWADILIPCI